MNESNYEWQNWNVRVCTKSENIREGANWCTKLVPQKLNKGHVMMSIYTLPVSSFPATPGTSYFSIWSPIGSASWPRHGISPSTSMANLGGKKQTIRSWIQIFSGNRPKWERIWAIGMLYCIAIWWLSKLQIMQPLSTAVLCSALFANTSVIIRFYMSLQTS